MKQYDLTIDFGTSYGKMAVFSQEGMVAKFEKVKVEDIRAVIDPYKIRHVIISSVSESSTKVAECFEVSGKKIILSHKLRIPIHLNYTSLETLGTDRIAAVVGAFTRFPGRNVLVIDAGTCITYDLIDSEGKYQGGSISPGLELKFKALHNYTRNLPLMERRISTELIGKSTAESILSGVINGTIAEMKEISRMYRNKFPHLQLVICGGDTEYYSKHLKNGYQYAPDLVLIGLKTILDTNV